MTVRILIVDDRPVVRKELRHILELVESILVVGEAEDGTDAIRQTMLLKPDIVLMDLEMPGMDGLEATRQIKTLSPAKKVIIFTVYADEINQHKALEAGADAFIVKGTDIHELLALFGKFSDKQFNQENKNGAF